jgi:hypothetical protein
MAKKPKKEETVSAAVAVTAPQAAFTPCNQCGNPGDCARAAKCTKGFK